MRSLLVICLWFSMSAAYAASCGAYLERSDTSGVANAHCPSCNNLNDYATYGAAMLYSNDRYRRVYVRNGGTEVEVILRNSYRSTPISIGWFGISINIRATNYAERLVDAFPRHGSVSGAPWNRQPVSTSSLRAKCKEIEAEQREKAIEELQKSLGFQFGGGFGGGGLGHGFNLPSNFQIPSWGFSGLGGDNRIPIVTIHEMIPCLSQPGDGSTC